MSKSLAKNALFNLFYKGLSIIFPLITVTYASRILLAHGIGLVSYAQSIVAYFAIFASLGIPNYGIREIAKISDRKQLNITFTNLFLLNAIITTACVIVYYSLISNVTYFQAEINLFKVVGIYIILNYLNIDWFYQGKEEYVYIAIRSFIVKIVFTILLFILIKQPSDYIKYAFLYYVAIAGNYVFNFIHLRKYLRFDFSNLELGSHIKPILVFFSATVAVELYQQLDVTLLGLLAEKRNVGFYFNSTRIMRVLANSLIAIGAVILPRISRYYTENKTNEIKKLITKLTSILVFVSLPFTVGMFVLADDMVLIMFGKDFIPAIPTLRILSILLFVLALIGGLTTPVLFSINREKKYFYTAVGAAIICFILNLLLIPIIQHNGSAIASVVTQLFILIMQMWFMRDYLDVNVILKYIIRVVGYASLMALTIIIVDNYIVLGLIGEFLVKTVVGGLIYISIALRFKDESLAYIMSKGNKLLHKTKML